MDFFTSKMWRDLNAEDAETRAAADARWQEAFRAYDARLNDLRLKLSSRQWRAIRRCHDFHDCVIESVSTEIRGSWRRRMVDVRLVLDNGRTVTLKNVTAFSAAIHNQTALPCGGFSWGYCEFEWLAADRLRLSLLCDVTNEIVIEFQTIECHRTPA